MSDGQFISQPLEQNSHYKQNFPPNFRNKPNTSHGAKKTSPWESMPEMRIILVMEMKEGKIYPMFVLEGGLLHGNIFGKYMNQQGVGGQSLSVFPYPQTTSSQGWIPREILAAP